MWDGDPVFVFSRLHYEGSQSLNVLTETGSGQIHDDDDDDDDEMVVIWYKISTCLPQRRGDGWMWWRKEGVQARKEKKNRTALHARGYRRSSVWLNLALSRSDRGRERKRGRERESQRQRERVGALRSACSRILTQIVGFVRRARVRQERMELSGV